MQQHDERGFLKINLLLYAHTAMIQVTLLLLDRTSEYTVLFTITSFVNRPIPYLMGSVCSAKVIYLSLSTHLGDFDFDL
jgi:hypothetical protein